MRGEEKGIKILHVDDEPDFLALTKVFLERENGDFSIEGSTSAEEGMELLKSGKFDAVITDYKMPGMDSLEFLQNLRQSGGDIPFIMFTGKGREEVAMAALNKGANYYLQKGVDVESMFGTLAHAIREGVEKKRAEDGLRRSEQKFKGLIETTTDWVWEVDAQGVYTYASPKIKELLGYEISEVLGKTPFDLMPEEESEKIGKFFYEKVINEEPFYGLENVNHHKDGHLVVLETSGIPIFDERGQLEGYRGIDRDITERKQAEERIEHLNSVLKAIRNANQLIIMEKDRDSLLQKACDALIEARGYDAAWLGFLSDGKTFATVKGSGFREDVARFCEHVMSGDHTPCIKKALAQKEKLVVVDKSRECGDCFFKSACASNEAAIIRIEYANRLFGLLAILFAPDVTANEEEKGLLKEVAGDIAFGLHDMEMEEKRKHAEEKVKEAYRLRDHFLKETSHRIITPVAIIGGNTDLLLESSNLDDDQKEKIHTIRERNMEVEKLVRDALAGKYLEEEEEEGEGGEG